MNICLITLNSLHEPGGLSTYYSQFARLLAEAGHQVFILSPDQESSPHEKDEQTKNGLITTITFKGTYATEKQKWAPYFRPGGFDLPNWIALGFSCRNWLLDHCLSHKIEVIQVPDYGGIGAFLSDASLPPVVVFGHGCLLQITAYNSYRKNDTQLRLLMELEKKAFQLADGIATHSQMNQSALEKITGRSVALTLPPWTGFTDPYSSKLSGEILIASSLQPIKGAMIMAAALDLIHTSHPDIKVSWYGADTCSGNGSQSVIGEIRKQFPQVADQQFLWKGPLQREKLLEKIAAAAIVVIPSEWESFSWTAIEAAAMGKPVIITETAGAAGLFKNGEQALVIKGSDPQALANALTTLYVNPQKAAEFGKAAREMITGVLKPDKIVTNRLDHFTWLLNERTLNKEPFSITDYLQSYRSSYRKAYYQLRKLIKKIIKPGA